MTIEYINTGTIANDGTGDALREAFLKVNDNFEDLDLRVIEETVIQNVGVVGASVFSGKNDGVNEFKKIVGGTNINVSETSTNITLNVPNSLDELLIISDSGSLTIAPSQSLSVTGGNGITTSATGQTLNIELQTTNIVSRDTLPTLSANLNAAGYDIASAGTITATSFNGELTGLVHGIDVRNLGSLTGFDFGTFRNTYTNAIEFIIANTDLDFGPFDPERGDTVDLGFLG
jgi:hypothetical protein|tara:strand:- start:547 stop:1242 length:696 start_codon:yes stop_codon:yes gene_type:complete